MSSDGCKRHPALLYHSVKFTTCTQNTSHWQHFTTNRDMVLFIEKREKKASTEVMANSKRCWWFRHQPSGKTEQCNAQCVLCLWWQASSTRICLPRNVPASSTSTDMAWALKKNLGRRCCSVINCELSLTGSLLCLFIRGVCGGEAYSWWVKN